MARVTNTYDRSFAQKDVFNVRAHLPLVRESELVLARTKKGYYVCLKNKLLNQEQLNVKSREQKGTGKM